MMPFNRAVFPECDVKTIYLRKVLELVKNLGSWHDLRCNELCEGEAWGCILTPISEHFYVPIQGLGIFWESLNVILSC